MAFTLTRHETLKKGDFRGTRWIKKAETPHFALLLHKNEGGARKIGITIRKKMGGAVVRNRMRRLVREFYRHNKDLFPDRHDNLLRVKGIPQKLTWMDTEKELQELMHSNIR